MKNKKYKNEIKFYIDTSVMLFSMIKFVVEDYCYWFNKSDNVSLTLFTSTNHPLQLEGYLDQKRKKNLPTILFLKEQVKPEELHKFYTKRFLLNEWCNYKKNDIFRLYKICYPLNSDINFDNQAISIQYDIRYHNKRNDDYSSYKKEQLAAVESSLHFYKPETIFDMGCGAGAQYYYLKESLERYNTKYYGVDISRFQTIKAIDLYESKNVTFSLGNAMQLSLKDTSIDLAFSESTIPFLSDPVKGLSELNRVSKNGFFASLYTIKRKHDFLLPYKKNDIYSLDTGATWKYLNKITPNIYYLPEYRLLMDKASHFKNTIVIEENSDQFFEPLGIITSNLFFFPKQWYKATRNISFNFKPLM